MFMKWFNKERDDYVLTFPVETMAMLADGTDCVDQDYADFKLVRVGETYETKEGKEEEKKNGHTSTSGSWM
jgi:hypothetical protein